MKYDEIMLETAQLWANMSYCKRLKVGAVLAKENRILATAYNGTISGAENNCEEEFYICKKCKSNEIIINQYKNINTNIDELDIECSKCDNKEHFNYDDFINVKQKYVKDAIFSTSKHFKKEFKTNPFVVHAEQNIITFCAKNGINTNDSTLYITHSPCTECAKLIYQSGIKRVVYINEYRDLRGVEFLKKIGVEVFKKEI